MPPDFRDCFLELEGSWTRLPEPERRVFFTLLP
jgi:hypothetical protein